MSNDGCNFFLSNHWLKEEKDYGLNAAWSAKKICKTVNVLTHVALGRKVPPVFGCGFSSSSFDSGESKTPSPRSQSSGWGSGFVSPNFDHPWPRSTEMTTIVGSVSCIFRGLIFLQKFVCSLVCKMSVTVVGPKMRAGATVLKQRFILSLPSNKRAQSCTMIFPSWCWEFLFKNIRDIAKSTTTYPTSSLPSTVKSLQIFPAFTLPAAPNTQPPSCCVVSWCLVAASSALRHPRVVMPPPSQRTKGWKHWKNPEQAFGNTKKQGKNVQTT